MKSGEPNPSINAIDVASAVTTAEWLLGIPPVAQKIRSMTGWADGGLLRKMSIVDFKI